MEGYAILSGHRGLARAFFLTFQCLGTYLVMNVFVSFVMEAFTTEMELEEAEKKQDSFRRGGRLDLSVARHGGNVRAEMSPMERLMDKMFGDEEEGDKDTADGGV
jgi:hypothetical protein